MAAASLVRNWCIGGALLSSSVTNPCLRRPKPPPAPPFGFPEESLSHRAVFIVLRHRSGRMTLFASLALGLLGAVHRTKTLAFDVCQPPRNLADAALHEKLHHAGGPTPWQWIGKMASCSGVVVVQKSVANAKAMGGRDGFAGREASALLLDACPLNTSLEGVMLGSAHYETMAHPLKDHRWVARWRTLEHIMAPSPVSWLDSPCALLMGVLKLCNLLAFLLASLQRDRKRLLSGSMAVLLLLHSLAPAVQAVEEGVPAGGAAPAGSVEPTGSAAPTSTGDHAMVANAARPLLERRGSTAASSGAWQQHGVFVSSPHSTEGTMLAPAAARRLQSTTTVSTVAELTAAVADASIGRILLAAGTYAFSSGTVCSANDDPSALCISRDVSLEALEPGTVVLDAQGTSSSERRVMRIVAGTVGLIGLTITGGYATYVSGLAWSALSPACFCCTLVSSCACSLHVPAV